MARTFLAFAPPHRAAPSRASSAVPLARVGAYGGDLKTEALVATVGAGVGLAAVAVPTLFGWTGVAALAAGAATGAIIGGGLGVLVDAFAAINSTG